MEANGPSQCRIVTESIIESIGETEAYEEVSYCSEN